MSNFKTLAQYFSDRRLFVVPYYQRGYKWSLQKNEKRGDLHLRLLLTDFKREFNSAIRDGKIIPNYEYHLQGITTKQTANEIELVDGQQRTTSLFILFCLFKSKGLSLSFSLENKMKYNVRDAANKVLQGFLKGKCEGDEQVQDIAALKKAWRICEEELLGVNDLELFGEFIQNNIKIIYITLDHNQDETKVFSMMNQDKAEMSQTDLIKSNILREASRQVYHEISQQQGENQLDGLEWQINQLRTKYATEWDDWRKWWEDERHFSFAKMIALPSKPKDPEPNLAILFKLYQRYVQDDKTKDNDNGLFEYFKDKIAATEDSNIQALQVWERLRLLQNIIQEWFESHEIYNYLGLLFKGSGLIGRGREEKLLELINRYLENKNGFIKEVRNQYIKIIFEETTKEDFLKSLLNELDAYHQLYTPVCRQLLRMNAMMANKQKHKFEFDLYEEDNLKKKDIDVDKTRSLEHIKPQTYVNLNLSEGELMHLNSLTNTIGNLVLVPRGLNSKLSNWSFHEKKEILFKEILNISTKNQGLWLHTLSVFGSKSDWLAEEIESNKRAFTTDFNDFFK